MTKPLLSTSQIRSLASSSLRPRRRKNDRSCFATPCDEERIRADQHLIRHFAASKIFLSSTILTTPADPAPKKRMRWSWRGVFAASEATLAQAANAPSTTAPVPWMSSFHWMRKVEKKVQRITGRP